MTRSLPMKPLTEEHLAILRRHMVEIVEMHFDLAGDETEGRTLDPELRRALMAVPRHLFVPTTMILACYQDSPVPIGFAKTLSQPFIGALMLDLLGVRPGMRVLEVGTGLGYQAAVMADIGATVFSVEVVEEFAELAEARFNALGYDVNVRVGDGSRGWAEHAPFDAVLVTAAAAKPPQDLVDQLQPGGTMVLPLGGEEVQQLTVIEKTADGETKVHPGMAVRFTQLELAG
ncbi:protein-L-isoaspartate(D-aspartate) O-methyltransferase [Croceibacterium sp. LX-88]|uniref:Protein-L-isoaspartate O-methyltransferase n=1 Tax=Croceibacterium selenioxidans TaxID=2838833 RepID=A0ABS5W706_9SPHN|nr:protein-L-isoaspartate(D-aspartate) O-methyltransferase [Croceibacterium selenioxidans]